MPDDYSQAGIDYDRMPPREQKGRFGGDSGQPRLDHALLGKIRTSVLDRNPAGWVAALEACFAHGLSTYQIADHYIPAAAIDLGCLWEDDDISFAAVSIGTARLQSMLRDLGPAWSGDRMAGPQAPTVLLVVAEGCHHTLGAMVLAGMLRRRGLSVRIVLGGTAPDIATRVQQSAFDAVFLSVALPESLEKARKIVKSVKLSVQTPPKLVVGGPVLNTEPLVKDRTGADFTTNDPDEAISLCGLNEILVVSAKNTRGH